MLLKNGLNPSHSDFQMNRQNLFIIEKYLQKDQISLEGVFFTNIFQNQLHLQSGSKFRITLKNFGSNCRFVKWKWKKPATTLHCH